MCGCSSGRQQTSQVGANLDPNALTFRVEDMTCGHCAGTIKKAIETGLPGTAVDADPRSKLVSVKGASSFSKLRDLVVQAGYTPSASPLKAA
ncbi:MAG: copper chaperone [Stutzerimonas stutzeri]|nr:MAG: copper chaperone [Stutzerimonas stutzeri]